jgi:DNA-binding GntR family transcriptional regulator
LAENNGVPATQAVHDKLRQLILEGDLPPGSAISQLELSRRLSVSRTPLREALRLLEREGLIDEARPHQLVRVSTLSMLDLDDLYSLRVMGEALAIWLTVPALRDEDFERLQVHLEGVDSDSPEAATKAHADFHRALRIGAGSRLADQCDRLFAHAERYQRTFVRIDDSVAELKRREHAMILDACRSRDRRAARDLLVDHIADTATSLMTAERHAPFALPTAVRMAKADV